MGMKWFEIFVSGAIAVIVIGTAAISFLAVRGSVAPAPAPIACTAEAKICPDGTSVGRTGPSCEFAPCPETNHGTITAEDNGKTFSYPIMSRFTVELDQSQYPKTELSCSPDGILGSISSVPAVAKPLYSARFETVAAGRCTLGDRDFSVTIIATEATSTPATTTPSTAGGGAPLLSSGIQGIVMLGPTCPVERIPPDPECADKPYATGISVSRVGSQSVVATGTSDASGTFKILLLPGDYTVTAAGGATLPRCNSVDVTVATKTVATTNISCDTGIR